MDYISFTSHDYVRLLNTFLRFTFLKNTNVIWIFNLILVSAVFYRINYVGLLLLFNIKIENLQCLLIRWLIFMVKLLLVKLNSQFVYLPTNASSIFYPNFTETVTHTLHHQILISY